MNVTIKDIAKQADVSYGTVSRALNNKYGVGEQTRARILEIAKRLDYSPNAIARGLVKKQTKTIGLIIPDITNPYFPEVAKGIEDEAKRAGYSVFLCNSNWERDRQTQYIELLAERRVDGFIIASVADVDDPVGEKPFYSIPVVYVSNFPQNTSRSYVVVDNARGGFLATQHLIEAGYQKIGFIGAVEQSQPIDGRLLGYKSALARYGLPVEGRYIKLGHYIHEQETAEKFMQEMIRSGDYPHAVFAENDLFAFGVIQGVREMGLSVPENVAVVGFDDISFAGFKDVQLTTVSQPMYDMGITAVQLLFEELNFPAARSDRISSGDGNDRSAGSRSRRVVILEPKLIVRETSGVHLN